MAQNCQPLSKDQPHHTTTTTTTTLTFHSAVRCHHEQTSVMWMWLWLWLVVGQRLAVVGHDTNAVRRQLGVHADKGRRLDACTARWTARCTCVCVHVGDARTRDVDDAAAEADCGHKESLRCRVRISRGVGHDADQGLYTTASSQLLYAHATMQQLSVACIHTQQPARPLCTSTCASRRHLQLTTGAFCCCRVLLPAWPCCATVVAL